jgi:hypothetical protein
MGFLLLISGFIAVLAGLWMIVTVPAGSMYGIFILFIGVIFILYGLFSRKEVQEESQKPMMDVVADSNYDDKSDT